MCVCHNDDRLDALDGNPPACTFSKIGCDFEHALCKLPRVLVVDAVDEAYDLEATQLDHAGAVPRCACSGARTSRSDALKCSHASFGTARRSGAKAQTSP